VFDVSISPDGFTIATSSRDAKTRLFNSRDGGKMVAEFEAPEGQRDTQIIWINTHTLLTLGFGKMSRRSVSAFPPLCSLLFISHSPLFLCGQMSLWDTNDLKAPIKTVELQSSTAYVATSPLCRWALGRGRLPNVSLICSAVLCCGWFSFPLAHYDEDSCILFLANHVRRRPPLLPTVSLPLFSSQVQPPLCLPLPGVCVWCGVVQGGRIMSTYNVTPKTAPYLDALSEWMCGSDLIGWAFLPKTVCDVKKVEIARCIRLTKDTAVPVNFLVPRKRVCLLLHFTPFALLFNSSVLRN
jgi:hypothetical protein